MAEDTRSQLVADARQIAVYRNHATYNGTGLQSPDVLQAKYEAEILELKEAALIVSQHERWLHMLHETSDVLYYAACRDAQAGEINLYPAALRECTQLLIFHTGHVTPDMVEAAALAKYGYRASAPGMKNEEVELRLIAEAIGQLG